MTKKIDAKIVDDLRTATQEDPETVKYEINSTLSCLKVDRDSDEFIGPFIFMNIDIWKYTQLILLYFYTCVCQIYYEYNIMRFVAA